MPKTDVICSSCRRQEDEHHTACDRPACWCPCMDPFPGEGTGMVPFMEQIEVWDAEAWRRTLGID